MKPQISVESFKATMTISKLCQFRGQRNGTYLKKYQKEKAVVSEGSKEAKSPLWFLTKLGQKTVSFGPGKDAHNSVYNRDKYGGGATLEIINSLIDGLASG